MGCTACPKSAGNPRKGKPSVVGYELYPLRGTANHSLITEIKKNNCKSLGFNRINQEIPYLRRDTTKNFEDKNGGVQNKCQSDVVTRLPNMTTYS